MPATPVQVVLPVRPGARRERTMTEAEYDRRLALLVSPFAANEIERLPKGVAKGGDKSKCEPGTSASADGYHCGGWHARSVHLSYVGHAGITQRLCQVDPHWYLEILANPDGTPLVTSGRWQGVLHVLDLERVCYGDATGLSNDPADPAKVAYGDLLRNGAMRMGVATYLWAKSDAAQLLTDNAPAVAPAMMEAAAQIMARAVEIVEETPEGPERTNALLSLAKRADQQNLVEVEVTLPEHWQAYAKGHMVMALGRALQGARQAPTESENQAAATAEAPAVEEK